MPIKPGYRTSEFWLTLVSFIFSGLYLMGILHENQQKEDLIEIVSHGVESCILIGGQIMIFYKYIKGRERVKTAAHDGKQQGGGTNKSRSRKTNKKPTSKSTKR